jgi:tRNA dimethylallyltransferase
MLQKYLICIVGPTGVGKTKLAIKLAKHYKTEIISADSRQFYKELNIGVAKPNIDELNAAKHHFIGHKSITEYYSAGDFERDAEQVLKELFKNTNIVIAVGGSGLYIKALTLGLDDMPPVDLDFRHKLIDTYNNFGITALQNILKTEDPYKFKTIDIQNPQRVMRAIEQARHQIFVGSTKKQKPYTALPIVINLPREKLYSQINCRVDKMVKNGLVEEAKHLISYKSLNALKTVGYTELFEYFEGKYNLNTAIALIKQHTRNYAKKQITWFKKEFQQNWFEPTDFVKISELIDKKITTVKNH